MVRILSLLPILTALYAITSVSALGSFDTEFASGGNLTARGQSSGWATHKCANVASSFGSFRFNFGCLCQDDVDDFCRNNNINGYIKGLLNAFVSVQARASRGISAESRSTRTERATSTRPTPSRAAMAATMIAVRCPDSPMARVDRRRVRPTSSRPTAAAVPVVRRGRTANVAARSDARETARPAHPSSTARTVGTSGARRNAVNRTSKKTTMVIASAPTPRTKTTGRPVGPNALRRSDTTTVRASARPLATRRRVTTLNEDGRGLSCAANKGRRLATPSAVLRARRRSTNPAYAATRGRKSRMDNASNRAAAVIMDDGRSLGDSTLTPKSPSLSWPRSTDSRRTRAESCARKPWPRAPSPAEQTTTSVSTRRATCNHVAVAPAFSMVSTAPRSPEPDGWAATRVNARFIRVRRAGQGLEMAQVASVRDERGGGDGWTFGDCF